MDVLNLTSHDKNELLHQWHHCYELLFLASPQQEMMSSETQTQDLVLVNTNIFVKEMWSFCHWQTQAQQDSPDDRWKQLEGWLDNSRRTRQGGKWDWNYMHRHHIIIIIHTLWAHVPLLISIQSGHTNRFVRAKHSFYLSAAQGIKRRKRYVLLIRC